MWPKDHELGLDQATERFYRLIWPHAATVLRTAQFLCRQSAEADDAAQETMVKAFRSIDQYQDGSDAKAWLLTILRNTRIDRLRSSANQRSNVSLDQLEVDLPDEPVNESEPSANVADVEAMLESLADPQVIAAMKQLPHDICWTLLLVDVEGMDQQDAAKILQVPTGTVKSRASRGRAMLRQSLLPMAKQMRIVR